MLPYEGVNDRDYETHIAKCHIFAFNKLASTSQQVLDNETLTPSQSAAKTSYKDKLTSFPTPSRKNGFFHNLSEQDYRNDKPNVIEDDEWTIYSSAQNLTSALNDPSKARSYYDNLFTKDWGFNFIEPSTIAAYPTSKKSSQMLFESYVKKVNKRSKKQLNKTANVQKDLVAYESQSQAVVPSLFFESSFNLEDNETFTNLLCLFNSNKSEDNLEVFFEQMSMNDIQKSLSEYLDVVEQDLAQQICKRSKDFFQVMSSMDLVMEKLRLSIKQVTSIRQNCDELEENIVRPIEKNIELTHLRNMYRDCFKKINWIATVHQTQPTIQLLLSKNDYAGALDLISTSQEVVAQELSGVISFR